MFNLLLLVSQSVILSFLVLLALRFGKEALIVLFCLQGLLANLFLLKQISLFGFIITCTDTYTIGCYFCLGLLQLYFGEKAANQAILLGFLSLAILLIMSLFQVAYIPSVYDSYDPIYRKILGTTPRIALTSLGVALLSQRLNLFLQKKLQNILPTVLVISLPILISQFVDTLLFTLIALYGQVHHLGHIVFISYLVKAIALFCVTPFTILSKKFYSLK